ncbi:MAG: polyamine aminopropyltransferase [Gammaproteobacteria bacterium]
MSLDNSWFSEAVPEQGTAFSLKLGEGRKLEEIQTQFQKIEIYDTQNFGKLMVIDGYIMLTSRDNFLYHEMMSHPVLFTHPDPKRILIIGGGDCGTLKEVLKHPTVELAQQVDIDEQVTRLSEKYFPELCESNGDDRAELHFDDGIKWVSKAQAGFYDVIIVDSTDPVGPGEVLFSPEFFRNCHRALADNGLLVQQSESPLLHAESIILPMHKNMRDSGFQSTQTLNFPQPCYPSGWWSCTMAAKTGQMPQIRTDSVENRPFINHYYNVDIHSASTALPEFLKIMIG